MAKQQHWNHHHSFIVEFINPIQTEPSTVSTFAGNEFKQCSSQKPSAVEISVILCFSYTQRRGLPLVSVDFPVSAWKSCPWFPKQVIPFSSSSSPVTPQVEIY